MTPVSALEKFGNDPLMAFMSWFNVACNTAGVEADIMTLATATPDGKPSARIVLFKGLRENKIFFVSNYESRKAQQLTQNAHAALVFYWPKPLYWQVRFEGLAERAPRHISEEYFASRPRESQISAWTSPQSQEIHSWEDLKALQESMAQKFGQGPIPCPPFWGGFLFDPERVEFWVGREARLHERLLYERRSGGWQKKWLAP